RAVGFSSRDGYLNYSIAPTERRDLACSESGARHRAWGERYIPVPPLLTLWPPPGQAILPWDTRANHERPGALLAGRHPGRARGRRPPPRLRRLVGGARPGRPGRACAASVDPGPLVLSDPELPAGLPRKRTPPAQPRLVARLQPRERPVPARHAGPR